MGKDYRGSIPVPINPSNGHKSDWKPHTKEETHNLTKVSLFLFKSFHIRRLQTQLFFSPTQIPIFLALRNSAYGYILILGHLWCYLL